MNDQITGRLLIPSDGVGPLVPCRLIPGTIRWENDRIASIESIDVPLDAIDGPVVLPGLIDAHLHLPQFPIIGAHGRRLLDWLNEVVFPAEAAWNDLAEAERRIERVADDLISYGTVGVAGFATSNADAAARAIERFTGRGFKGWIGHVLMDRNAPDALIDTAETQLNQTESMLRRFAGGPVRAAVTPRFAISCSDALLSGAGHLARRHSAPVQTHLSETVAECEAVAELFGGADYVDAYDHSGLLSDQSYFGHGIHLSDRERNRLSQTGSVVVHCPTANSFLRSGNCDVATLTRSGVDVLCGSDIGAGYERSMVRVARAAIETAARIGDEFPTAAEMMYRITTGAARRMGLPTGELAIGKSADLVVVDPADDWFGTAIDPLAAMMFGWDDRRIERVVINGRTAYRRV